MNYIKFNMCSMKDWKDGEEEGGKEKMKMKKKEKRWGEGVEACFSID